MTRIAPISRAVLDAVLLNDHMESVLALGGGPQSLALKLSNLTDYDIALPKGTTVTLTFRPGALVDADKVSATGTGWDVARQGTHLPSLLLTRDSDEVIAAGEEMIVMLSNLTPSANGASRSTRVELAYDGIRIGDGDALTGRRTVHLSLLYPNVPMGQVLGHKGITGNFKAELVGSADIRTGRKENSIRVRLAASAPVPIKANASMLLTDDCAKVSVAFPRSEDNTGQGHDSITLMGDIITRQDGAMIASSGGAALAAFGSSGFESPGLRRNTPAIALANAGGQQSPRTVSVVMDRWQSHGDTIFYASASEEPLLGDFLEFGVSIKTGLAPGAYPLTVRIENVNGQNVDIALLLNVTAFAMPGTDPVDAYIDVPGKLAIKSDTAEIHPASGLTVWGDLTITDDLRVGKTARFNSQVEMWGHLKMFAYAGRGQSGTAYVQARDDSAKVDLSMQLRTQKQGSAVDVLRLTSDGHGEFESDVTIKGDLTVSKSIYMGDDFHFGVQKNWYYFRNKKSLSIFYISEYDNYVGIGTGNSVDKPLFIDAKHNVGINTKKPKTALEVNGDITAKNLEVGDQITTENKVRIGRGKNHISVTDWRVYFGSEWSIGYTADDSRLNFYCGDKTVFSLNKSGIA